MCTMSGPNFFFAFVRDWRTRRSTAQTPRFKENITTGSDERGRS